MPASARCRGASRCGGCPQTAARRATSWRSRGAVTRRPPAADPRDAGRAAAASDGRASKRSRRHAADAIGELPDGVRRLHRVGRLPGAVSRRWRQLAEGTHGRSGRDCARPCARARGSQSFGPVRRERQALGLHHGPMHDCRLKASTGTEPNCNPRLQSERRCSPRHARGAALHHALDFGQRRHARVAGRRHRQRAVRGAALDRPLRAALASGSRRSGPRRTSRRRRRGPRSRGRSRSAPGRTRRSAQQIAPQSLTIAVRACAAWSRRP